MTIEEAREALRELKLDASAHKGMTRLTEYDITVILRAAIPIITKQVIREKIDFLVDEATKVWSGRIEQAQEDERKEIAKIMREANDLKELEKLIAEYLANSPAKKEGDDAIKS